MCEKSNVGYEGDCCRCEQAVQKYVGETSRTSYTRVKEHLTDYRSAAASNLPALPTTELCTGQHRKQIVKSWMWEHTRDVHGGVVGAQGGVLDYKFTVAGTFRRCLQRQVDEGLRMTKREKEGCVLLNSKNEWFTPRLIVPTFVQN